MGLRIGDISGALLSGRMPEASARVRDEESTAVGRLSRGREGELRAGFGENSISIPGLVARTLGRNLSEARKMVPTVGEVLEEQQARAEQRRLEARKELEARRDELQEDIRDSSIRIDFRRAEAQARAQVRQFGDTGEGPAAQNRARIEAAEPSAQFLQPSGPATADVLTFVPTAAQFDLRG